MSKLDLSEHLNCRNYDNKERPLIDYLTLAKNEVLTITSLLHKILLVRKGTVIVSSADTESITVSEGRLMVLHSAGDFELRAKNKESKMLIFRSNGVKHLCDRYPMEKLLTDVDTLNGDSKPYLLAVNEHMKLFIDSLMQFVSVGARCYYLHKIKCQELLFVLRIFYTKEELAQFLLPILSSDMTFSEKLSQAVDSAHTLQDLADATGYSVSGFNKKFRAVYGQAPYQWLQSYKAKKIYKELSTTNTPLKAISQEQGFAHTSELHKFCKKHFGCEPHAIREIQSKDEKE